MNVVSKYKYEVLAAIALIVMVAIGFSYGLSKSAKAAAPGGLYSTIATTSNPAVTNTQSLVFATSSCIARVITTYASPIMVTFGDVAGNGGPTGVYGHLQPASTTVVYDGGQYGCGAVRIYSFVSQNITVSESR